MLTRKTLISAMVGLAMMALPVTALAGHHDHYRNNFARPNAPHDQGLHRGWFKHRDERPVPAYGWRNYSNNYNYYPPAPAWHHEPDADDFNRVAPAWHHEPDADDFNRVGPAWHQEPDADDWGGYNYNYGPGPAYYNALPPTGYNSGQQLSWLLARRQAALRSLNMMRARGDSRAAGRMAGVLNGLDARIRRLNGGYAPARMGYNAPLTSYLGNPYGGNAYNAYPYNQQYYGNSPTMNLLGSIVRPMLGMP